MSAFDSELLTPEDLWRRLRDIEDSLLQIERGRGTPRFLGKPTAVNGDPQDGDLARFDAAEDGWLLWSPKYMTATLSGNQTGNLGAGNQVEFDTALEDSGHITIQNDGFGNPGQFSLPEGLWIARISSSLINFSGSTGQLNLRWIRNPGNITLGSGPAVFRPPSSGSDQDSSGETEVIVDNRGAESILLELRILNSTAITSIGSNTGVTIFALA